jgi:hypothetical protein
MNRLEENNGNSKEYSWGKEMPRGIGYGDDNTVFVDGKAYTKGSESHIEALKNIVNEDDIIFSSVWKSLMGLIFFGGIVFSVYNIFVAWVNS